jgi:hypothetical protein
MRRGAEAKQMIWRTEVKQDLHDKSNAKAKAKEDV